MTTAVDSNILLDVFGRDAVFGAASAQALRTALQAGSLIACEIVWAEVTASFASPAAALDAFNRLNLQFSAISVESALDAGVAWKAYRKQGGQRVRVVADFLIGAHALRQADRLLTRDRGFYRAYFKRLAVTDPSST
ncbi:MAG: type II toxin-antitoxin system VapC family toxin [Terriglobia bacterium]